MADDVNNNVHSNNNPVAKITVETQYGPTRDILSLLHQPVLTTTEKNNPKWQHSIDSNSNSNSNSIEYKCK